MKKYPGEALKITGMLLELDNEACQRMKTDSDFLDEMASIIIFIKWLMETNSEFLESHFK